MLITNLASVFEISKRFMSYGLKHFFHYNERSNFKKASKLKWLRRKQKPFQNSIFQVFNRFKRTLIDNLAGVWNIVNWSKSGVLIFSSSAIAGMLIKVYIGWKSIKFCVENYFFQRKLGGRRGPFLASKREQLGYGMGKVLFEVFIQLGWCYRFSKNIFIRQHFSCSIWCNWN